MQIQSMFRGDVLILDVRGTLNAHGSAQMLRSLAERIVQQGHRRVVFDCGRLKTVDSPGFDALLQCLQTLRLAGGDLKLARITRTLKDLVVIAGMVRAFDVHETVPAAVNAFGELDASQWRAAA